MSDSGTIHGRVRHDKTAQEVLNEVSKPYKNIDVDQTEDEVFAGAGELDFLIAINLTAAPLYLKLYDALSSDVSVGTTVPDLTIPVPGNADSDGAGFVLPNKRPLSFANGLTIAATTGVADNDTGAPAANALVVNLGYNN